ncbi:MAG TPA: cytochrome b/b6 domain-containing protein [Alphaproteobacteria bacterium]|nr:cytochrome b/b6 domain-containing protein [Alphaproteobacteria bacterium]
MKDKKEIVVWDLPVRIGHWVLVAAFAVAYLTEGEPKTLHVWTGYLIAGIVVLRVLWGLVGPRHARFSDFVYGPAAVLGYLRDLVGLRARRYLGHSPAGGAMVVALLLSLAATTLTGMATLAGKDHEGPLASFITSDAGIAPVVLVPAAMAGEREGEDEGGKRRRAAFQEVHEVFANLTLVLVLLHVAGVTLASLMHRENLTRAMVTGRKWAE